MRRFLRKDCYRSMNNRRYSQFRSITSIGGMVDRLGYIGSSLWAFRSKLADALWAKRTSSTDAAWAERIPANTLDWEHEIPSNEIPSYGRGSMWGNIILWGSGVIMFSPRFSMVSTGGPEVSPLPTQWQSRDQSMNVWNVRR